jgi:asparagine synthase (glutamine-hydrolysing)
MKELWAAGIAKQINQKMLFNYIDAGHLYNPLVPSETFYSNIFRLEPAHYVSIDTRTLSFQMEQYWTIETERISTISFAEASDRFYELFMTSVSRRLRSDVPVGSSLSGGLDSSAVVCAIDALNKNKTIHQKTFSAQFPGFEKDESYFQQLVINQTQADAFFTYPDGDKMLAELDTVFWHQEEPFGSASIMAQYEVFKLAKQQNVTVLLDGQGADEVLAGYHSYYPYFFIELQKNKTEYQKQWTEYLKLHANNPVNGVFKKDLKYKIRSALPFATEILKKGRDLIISRRGDFDSDFYGSMRNENYKYLSNIHSLNQILKESSANGPLQELLRYADRNSMAHSREVRLPFLNHDLVEFLFNLPATYKINNGWTKFIMRKSFENRMPNEITWRVDKIGYEPPQKKWMQKPEVRDIIHESRKVLVSNHVLDKAILEKEMNPGGSLSGGDNSWRFWMSAYLFQDK